MVLFRSSMYSRKTVPFQASIEHLARSDSRAQSLSTLKMTESVDDAGSAVRVKIQAECSKLGMTSSSGISLI